MEFSARVSSKQVRGTILANNFRAPRPGERAEILLRRRNVKMARSAHAYVRGSTARFYEWLEESAGKVPSGPPVWICGDCHVGNLGPLAGADGHVDIQIRDLDQTVIGNPAHDLIRLGLSLASAARGSDLPGVTTAHMLEEIIAGYREALKGRFDEENDAERPKPVQLVLEQALKRRWRHLAMERIEDVSPSIPLGKRFWALSRDERKEIRALAEDENVRALVTGLKKRNSTDPIEIVDAAYWMKGCSSLGRLRYAVLVGVGKAHREKGSFCLLDIKEAAPPSAPRDRAASMPRNNSERIVAGARALAPNLGERMMAARLLGKSVVIRELMPQDLKIEIDRLTRDEAMEAARYLAGIVGLAHRRQMDRETARSWAQDLARQHTKSLDAPSWLWSSVVELAGIHEVAYLDHCRRYALSP
jgi:uncharacterized protein (DUF2252 family)